MALFVNSSDFKDMMSNGNINNERIFRRMIMQGIPIEQVQKEKYVVDCHNKDDFVIYFKETQIKIYLIYIEKVKRSLEICKEIFLHIVIQPLTGNKSLFRIYAHSLLENNPVNYLICAKVLKMEEITYKLIADILDNYSIFHKVIGCSTFGSQTISYDTSFPKFDNIMKFNYALIRDIGENENFVKLTEYRKRQLANFNENEFFIETLYNYLKDVKKAADADHNDTFITKWMTNNKQFYELTCEIHNLFSQAKRKNSLKLFLDNCNKIRDLLNSTISKQFNNTMNYLCETDNERLDNLCSIHSWIPLTSNLNKCDMKYISHSKEDVELYSILFEVGSKCTI